MTLDATEALVAFMTHAIHRQYRERYVRLASSPKARQKILDDFYHRFCDRIDTRTLISALPPSVWRAPAYSFAPPDEFGEEAASLKSAYDSHSDAFLIITRDAHYGVHREEGYSGKGGTRQVFVSLSS